MTALRALLIVLIGFALGAAPATAQELTDEQWAEAMDFAMHDATFTLYHEMGHLLVGELGIPVLGKEEDAADALAAVMLLNEEDEDEAFNTLIDSSDGWYFNSLRDEEEFYTYDEHSLDIQRAFAMVCLMVGADPKAFGETADTYELDPDQQEGCSFTYQQANDSWTTLLEPHAVTGEKGAEITVLYEDAGDYADFGDELKARQVLEKAADFVTANYVLPRPITFRAALCGEANAHYDPEAAEILYCYELAEDLFNLYVENVITGVGEAEPAK